ncbi:penicillin-binding protein [Fulvivirgaceae bacterium BMA10]|uniref:Penicillin-binding protein n=1 Tax=Splendidivirga corallicola TaxID=3051826 RepID=A0ABT8KPH2_9BACT|nr:penicillin-binding protein [Fulvivirgaceae bacterium BMA10]
MNIKRAILIRARLAFLAVFIFAVAIIVRIVRVQYVEGDQWKQMAEDIGLQYRTVKATRGNIYSDNGSLLATSLPFFRVAFDPYIAQGDSFRHGLDSLSLLLSKHFKEGDKEYYKRKIKTARSSKKRYLLLSTKKINYRERKMMSRWPIFRQGRLKGGVIFEKVDKRFRPFTGLGFRTIGYLNEDNYGAGLEYSFNDKLAGRDGKALYQKIAGGNWKPVNDGSEVPSVDGLDIETTIDINLQDITSDALIRGLQNLQADYGCAVIMEVETGEIKAIANLKRYVRGERIDYREIYNYAVQDATEPGSTFKLASMIALLEDSNVRLTDTINAGDGKFQYYDRIMPDDKYGGYGKITVKQAFEKSSNIAVSKMVNTHFGSNPHKFIKYLDRFGLTRPIGFQLIGEGVPYIKTPEDKTWSGTTLPWMSIGHELHMTPLQTLTFFNAIANNGKMIRPIIVKRVSKAGKTIDSYTSSVITKKVCSKSTLEKVKVLLEGVVENGTASNIKNSYYKIAGKTGTSKKVKKGGGYKREYYTSFAGYFPARNPRYSCIVVIDNPKGYKQYGSDVAAPVFKEIADKIYALDIQMQEAMAGDWERPSGIFPVIRAGNQEDLKLLCNELGISNHSQTDEAWVKSQRSNLAVKWRPNRIHPYTVPDVVGMTLRDAIYVLENNGLQVLFKGKGRVTEQSISPGKKVTKGNRITLKLG